MILLTKKNLIRKYDSKNNRIFIRPKESLVLNFQHITDFLEEKYYVNYNLVKQYINEISQRLYLTSETINPAIKIAERVCTSPLFIGNRPRNLAAAIINISITLSGRYGRTRRSISDVAGVSEPSIVLLSKKITQELRKYNE